MSLNFKLVSLVTIGLALLASCQPLSNTVPVPAEASLESVTMGAQSGSFSIAEKSPQQMTADLKKIALMPWFRGVHQRAVSKVELRDLNVASEGSLAKHLEQLSTYVDSANNADPSRTTRLAYIDMGGEYGFALVFNNYENSNTVQHALRVDFRLSAPGKFKPVQAAQYWRCKDSVTGQEAESMKPCVSD